MIITIANKKGGVGKTTIACHLITSIVNEQPDLNVIGIDTDDQMSFSKFASIRNSDETLTPITVFEKIKYDRNFHISLNALSKAHPIVIVDVGGRDTDLLRSCVSVSDVVIVPLQPDPFSVWSSDEFFDRLLIEKANLPNLKIIFLPNMPKGNSTSITNLLDILKDFKTKYEVDYFECFLKHRMAYSTSLCDGYNVLEYINNKPVKDWRCEQEFKSFYNEFISKIS